METEGIVLRIHDYGESDKLVTFFSPHIGRATAIAKGAKRSKKRFVNKLEPFTHLDMSCRTPRNGSLFFLSNAELKNAFLSLRYNYRRYANASFISELILSFTKDHDAETRLFHLLRWSHHCLDQGRSSSATLAIFMIKLLQFTGYQPDMAHCSKCRAPVTPRQHYSFLPQSGLTCSQCRRGTHITDNHFAMGIRTIRILHATQRMSIANLDRLHLPESSAKEAIMALSRYCRNILQQDLHGLEHLRNADKLLPTPTG